MCSHILQATVALFRRLIHSRHSRLPKSSLALFRSLIHFIHTQLTEMRRDEDAGGSGADALRTQRWNQMPGSKHGGFEPKMIMIRACNKHA